MAITDFTIIRRSMRARLFSTVTTIITVAVAVALMLVLLTMRDAGRAAFERGAGNMHLIVSRDSSPLVSVLNSVFYANAPARAMPWAKYQQLSESLPLEWAIPTLQGDSYRGYPVMATTPAFFEHFVVDPATPWKVAQGRLFKDTYEVVMGSQAAAGTGVRVGDVINLTHGVEPPRQLRATGTEDGGHAPHVHREFRFTVVGILAPTGSSHDRAVFADITSSWVLHAFDKREHAHGHDDHDEDDHDHDDHGHDHAHDDHDHAHDHDAPKPPMEVSELTDDDKLVTGVYMRVLTRGGADASAVLPSVFDTLRRDISITVASPTDQVRRLFGIIGNIDQLFVAMAAVVMVSSAIAIMLALYNSMEQRRRQVAVLRVLGASRGRIFGLVVTESALLGVLGALVGVAAAVVAAQIAAWVLKRDLGLVVNATISPEWALVVGVATVGLAALAGVLPAMIAYRTPVVRSLRPLG
jgi:putative ABC transport system permease protein